MHLCADIGVRLVTY